MTQQFIITTPEQLERTIETKMRAVLREMLPKTDPMEGTISRALAMEKIGCKAKKFRSILRDKSNGINEYFPAGKRARFYESEIDAYIKSKKGIA